MDMETNFGKEGECHPSTERNEVGEVEKGECLRCQQQQGHNDCH